MAARAPSHRMQGLLGEFKKLYDGRLAKLRAKISSSPTDASDKADSLHNYEAQVKVYESYVKDLSEQNEVLVQTVEELETEANGRVANLEGKLNKAVSTAKECNQKAKNFELELQTAILAKRKHEDIITDIQERYRRLESRYNEAEDNRADLEHDLHALVTVISVARRTGKWQVDGLRLRQVDFSRVFGEETPLKHSPKLQELNAELNRRASTITQLQAEIGAIRTDYDHLLETIQTQSTPSHSVTPSGTSSSSRPITELEVNVMKLKSELSALMINRDTLKQELMSREQQNASLQREITSLHGELSLKTDENTHLLESVAALERDTKLYSDQVCELNSKCDEFERKLYDRTEMLKIEISRRDVQAKNLKEEMNKLEDGKRDVEGEIANLESERKDAESELKIMTEKAKRYEGEMEELQVELEKVQKAYDSSHLECAQLAAQNARLEAELTSLQDEHVSTVNQLDRVSNGMQQLESTTRDKQKNLSNEVVEKQLELSTLRGRIAECEKKLEDSEKDCREQKELVNSLKEDYTSTKSQLYTSEAKLSDTERRLQDLNEKQTATVIKLETANLQLQEGRLSWDQQEQVLRQELMEKEESVQDGRSREAELQNKVTSLENQLGALNTQLGQHTQQAVNRQQAIDALNGTHIDLSTKLTSLQKSHSKLTKELSDLRSEHSQLKSDYELLLSQHEQRLEDNGRMEAKIRAHQINTQTETESLAQQVHEYDSELTRLRAEKAKVQELQSRQEEQCRKLHDKVEALAERNRGLMLDNEVKQRQVSDLSTDFEEKNRKCTSQTQDLLTQSDQVQKLTVELRVVTAARDELNQNMSVREEESANQLEKISSLKGKAEQLHQQSHSYEVEVRNLQNQLLQVERKLEQKTKEADRLSETQSKLQTSLADQQLAISQAKQSQNSTKSSLKTEIKRLEKVLADLRHELSNCKNQRDECEAELDRLRDENGSVSQRLQQCTHNRQELEQSLHKHELELTVSQQKNKTCQQEVASRDAVILKLQEDLDHVEHKYTVTLEESNDRQERLNSQKDKIQKQEGEGRQFQIQINKQTEEINNQAISINELKNELELARNEVKRHLTVIEALQDEVRQLRSSHTDEIRHYREDIALVQDQLSVNREEVVNLQTELNQQQELTAEAESISHQWTKDCEAARQQLASRGMLLSEMEKTVDEARVEIGRLEACVQQERTKSAQHQQRADVLEQKLLASNGHSKTLSQDHRQLQDMLAECRANVSLKCEEINKLQKEAKNTESRMADGAREVQHREDMIDRLTKEITTLQQELTKSHEKLSDYETSVQKLRSKLEHRVAECSNSEERYRSLHSEYISFKEQHQYDNEEVSERDERLRQLEDDLHSASMDLSEKNRQLLSIREEQSAQKSSISCLQDKISEAESEVTRLEHTLKETRDELDTTRQRFHLEIVSLEENVTRLERDLAVEREASEHLGKELEARDDLIQLNSAECQSLQEQLGQRLEEINILEEQVRLLRADVSGREKREVYGQSMIGQLQIDVDKYKADLLESRAECKGYAQELAHHEEKRLLLEQTLLTTKDQLKSRVSDNVKLEQMIARLQADMSGVHEHNVQLAQECDEVKQLLDGMETELNNKGKERDLCLEKEASTKLSLQRLQNDLRESEDRYKRLDAKYSEVDKKLQSCHSEQTKEQQKCRELDRLLNNYKSVITELQDDVEQLTRQNKDLSSNLTEKESLLKRHMEELDSVSAKLVVTKESLLEKEGQLRITLFNLETCEREKTNAMQRLESAELGGRQTSDQRDVLHEQLKSLEATAREKDRELSRVKSDLGSLQSNLNETVDQLNDKSKLGKQLKSQLNHSEKQSQSLAEEVSTYEKKVRNMKQDIKKLQDYNTAVKADLEKYERQVALMHDELQGQSERNKRSVEELAHKEEELVLTKVEAATLAERLSSKNQEMERIEEDLRAARNNHRTAADEVQALQAALEDARCNGDRLHHESEQVVRNVNGWVDEQKRANERLALKLREQSDTIRQLQTDKKTLTEEVQSSVNRVRQLEAVNAELKTEQLKLKSLQEHSSRQQTLLRQLQHKLEEYEHAQDADMKNKLSTIDDLQRQLHMNSENSGLLGSQISMLQKQNSQIRADLERECTNRHTLEATIEQKDDLIRTLKGQGASLRGSMSTRTRSPSRNKTPPTEDSSLDKSYWIQRVGELSMQLQQSSEYWSEKVGHLQSQLETK